eukprot:736652-Rhodomonas_salina.2
MCAAQLAPSGVSFLRRRHVARTPFACKAWHERSCTRIKFADARARQRRRTAANNPFKSGSQQPCLEVNSSNDSNTVCPDRD